MFYVSEIQNEAPCHFQTQLQQKVYEALEKLQIRGARVSFAPAEQMEIMPDTKIGAATVFSSLLDIENKVQIVFDKEVIAREWYGCSDGTTTGYMKVHTEDICKKFLPYTSPTLSVIEV